LGTSIKLTGFAGAGVEVLLESVMGSALEFGSAAESGVGFLVEFGLEMAPISAPVVNLLGLPLVLATLLQNSLLPLVLGSESVQKK
jgi:hypothetical protein